MANCVLIKLFNKTSERLVFDRSTENHGYWDVPETISPKSTADLRIISPQGQGSEGTIAFNVKTDEDDNSRAQVKAYARCPYLSGSNEFYLYPLKPEAVYEASFRSWTRVSGWHDNSVAPKGNPVHIEYTLEYATSRYRFSLVEIAARSDCHVRNSRGERITGTHYLWRSESAADWADGNLGSYAPNVFAYEFGSPVAEAGHLDVTIRPLDSELIGAEVIVYGSVDGIRTFQTDYFYIKSLNDVVVSAHTIHPAHSSCPFGKNADVVWSMELRQSLRGVLAVGPHETPLELYWLGAKTHPDFCHNLPVEVLRDAFCKPSSDCDNEEEVDRASPQITSSEKKVAMA
ncbi:hypothetical protein F4821DRAFT_254351 [Hypoxylon rubiginosum]|uniref:Uncharacterized protein n=1 Tax=Hypoxylon rubiginosum TaxID=110542 RepID=A0ACC0DJ67_9PEZI|nr:hypothetical protein F4821DRAFT_254351 [Hypoxylon rubiginosum]